MGGIIILLIFIGIALAIVYLPKFLRRQRISLNLAEQIQQQGRLDRKLERRLLQLLRGDRTAAKRLIERAKEKNPGRSENWYWEKVIYDLERDRYR